MGRSSLPLGVRFLFTTSGTAPFSEVSKAFARSNNNARRLGDPLAPWRPHDIRRTFASGCVRLGILVHVIENALNHTRGFGEILGVYQRHDYAVERRLGMDVWARHIMGLLYSPLTLTSLVCG